MRKVISHLIMTLDGVIQFDAVHQEIAELRENKEVLEDFFSKVENEDSMLLGRTTYEEWKDYWPTSEVQPFSDHINSTKKYVFSNSLEKVSWGDWNNIVLFQNDHFEKVHELKKQDGKNIGVHGSGTLVQSLIYANILDELRLEIYPVVSGSGRRLFSENSAIKSFTLSNQKITSNGVAILTYKPAKNA
ncbi:dihydrofolate reductase family protein [Agaribacterium sp. ZY112]|uniref:dihydrofolate reductase family protein n=1 Tax=Agaribacterium sp. ZY112 TaxID=3233574 RepID=UPI0035235B77